MPARVTLTITEGKLAGRRFVFDERTTCIIGRAKDCEPRVPNDADHRQISRHHCLLDINPPDVRVRDFGSLNGTYVNGQKIGQRQKEQSLDDVARERFPEVDLKDGDEIRLACTVFRMNIETPLVCACCSAEIPEEQQRADPGGKPVWLCEACRQKAEAIRGRISRRRTLQEVRKCCAKCGRDVTEEAGANREGEFICGACRSEPLGLLRLLLQVASTGEENALAIDGYQVVRQLGRGSMGAVYLARNARSGTEVALKVMLPQVAASYQATSRFLREIENTKILRHPNVVRLHESGCCRGTFFFTLEFCNVGSADRLMRGGGGTLPITQAVPIILQVLDGLDYAHRIEVNVQVKDGQLQPVRGLVHRDLKPHNIFLSRSGESMIAKVGDYGLAKAFDLAGLSGQTCTGSVVGTPHFMPRQQVLQFRYSKPEVDVWAAAASLYYMLSGFAPRDFGRGKDPWQVVLQTQAVPLRQRNATVPRRLAEVIDEALIDSPEIRFKTAAQLKHALQGAL